MNIVQDVGSIDIFPEFEDLRIGAFKVAQSEEPRVPRKVNLNTLDGNSRVAYIDKLRRQIKTNKKRYKR